jgi:probable rRNA maturation factor
MTPKPTGVEVTVSNRQRRRKINTRLLARVAERTLELVGDDQAILSIVLVGDAAIARLNEKYHATPGPTDILSFDYGEGRGELIISVEHAIAQAGRFRSTPARELVLYVVHGILHLHGHDDRKAPDRRRMRTAERRLLADLAKNRCFRGLIGRRMIV